MLKLHLVQLEEQIAQGEQSILRQRQVIAELEGDDGHDTTKAQVLLDPFEQMQVMHEAERDRILQELED
jgi:hypothetical protein